MLLSKRLCLRSLERSDLNETYKQWMNDFEVTRFLEIRFKPHSLDSIVEYWEEHRSDSSSPWFAICRVDTNAHIGNIKLGPINWIHRRADLSIFIGDRNSWGQGYASEAISLVRDWAFRELDLQKLNAGMCELNLPSRKAFEKCGFRLEATLREEANYFGRRENVIRLGLPRSSWTPN